jgi:hypothetical protein
MTSFEEQVEHYITQGKHIPLIITTTPEHQKHLNTYFWNSKLEYTAHPDGKKEARLNVKEFQKLRKQNYFILTINTKPETVTAYCKEKKQLTNMLKTEHEKLFKASQQSTNK